MKTAQIPAIAFIYSSFEHAVPVKYSHIRGGNKYMYSDYSFNEKM